MHLAIDIGATKTEAGVFSETGMLIDSERYPTVRDQSAFQDELFTTCDTLLGGRNAETVSLGVAGTVHVNGSFSSGGIGWREYGLNRDLNERYDADVLIDNDVNRAALAEARRGAVLGIMSAIYVSLSTGVGSAVILDGNIPNAMRTSEFGIMLMSGSEGTDEEHNRLEDIASGTGFKRQFSISPEHATDPDIWRTYARRLSKCLFNVSVGTFPEAIVLGGGVMNQYSRFGTDLERDFNTLFPEPCEPPKLKQATFINNGVLYGCYEASAEHMLLNGGEAQ